jgi:hypothetical protein
MGRQVPYGRGGGGFPDEETMKAMDLRGRQFGRLGVLRKVQREELQWPLRDEPNSFWHCECACGTPCIVRGCNLARGRTRSCGCYRRERIHSINAHRSRHPEATGLDQAALGA